MNQREVVITIMKENGGYATLGHIYQYVLKVPDCVWKTRTPFASMRRIVQDDRYFFKIKPGLWALNEYEDQLPESINELLKENRSKEPEKPFTHTYYQGLVVEIGNMRDLDTHIPPQDKNKVFVRRPLKELATLESIHEFTYPEVISKIKTIDVIWFNKRRFPDSVFEIEHSTNFYNSLLKFRKLQDFHVKFFVVGDGARKKEFSTKIDDDAFDDIRERVSFINYDLISQFHSRSFEYHQLSKELPL